LIAIRISAAAFGKNGNLIIIPPCDLSTFLACFV
jgi:hypothetical protein